MQRQGHCWKFVISWASEQRATSSWILFFHLEPPPKWNAPQPQADTFLQPTNHFITILIPPLFFCTTHTLFLRFLFFSISPTFCVTQFPHLKYVPQNLRLQSGYSSYLDNRIRSVSTWDEDMQVWVFKFSGKIWSISCLIDTKNQCTFHCRQNRILDVFKLRSCNWWDEITKLPVKC